MSQNNALSLWSESAQQQIKEAVLAAKRTTEQPFAVFDADNTIWKHDIEEALLAWLEYKGLLSIESLPTSIFPLPPRPNETIFSYYSYLADIDHALCYLWACQAFVGFSLQTIHQQSNEMLSSEEPIPTIIYQNGKALSRTVPIPKIFPAQRQLISFLMEQDINVWVVSASLEEIVRAVVSHPKYKLHIPPHRVIGVNLLLHKNDSYGAGALDRQQGILGLEHYFSEERLQYQFSSYPLTPLTWYSGKVAAIKDWIHPCQRPMLAAGDSPNDFHMQFYADADNSGIRLRIHRKQSHKDKLEEEKRKRTCNRSSDGNPYDGWLEVTAENLGIPD